MENKLEIGIIGAVVAVLLVVCIFTLITSDNTGPVIRVDESSQISYTEGQSKEVLLEGVTAYDEKDGDVTSSIRIESMFVSGDVLKVRYAAKDKHNNVTVYDKFREVTYIPSDGTTAEQQNGEDGNASSQENNQSGEQPDQNQGETVNNETDNAATSNLSEEPDTTEGQGDNNGEGTDNQSGEQRADATAAIDKEAVDRSGIPAIRLTDNEVTIDAGTNFYAIGYVDETYDDAGDVSGRVRVTGDYDSDETGDYELEFFVTDSDGNVSESKFLTLHVR